MTRVMNTPTFIYTMTQVMCTPSLGHSITLLYNIVFWLAHNHEELVSPNAFPFQTLDFLKYYSRLLVPKISDILKF